MPKANSRINSRVNIYFELVPPLITRLFVPSAPVQNLAKLVLSLADLSHRFICEFGQEALKLTPSSLDDCHRRAWWHSKHVGPCLVGRRRQD